MAIYRFSAQIITRNRSVVAAAAYRAGERLYDERHGYIANYSRKPGVEHTEILAPAGAPDWVFERERLWNEVTWRESHPRAQYAREIQIALPVELSHEAQLALARSFIRENFVAKGMIADFALHREVDDNPHVHILLTTRSITEDGFGLKERAWNRKTLLFEWREAWEHAANRALAHEGHAARIDCRSYDEREIGLDPQPKLYRHERETHLDARDHVLERSVELVKTKRRNGAYLTRHPVAALDLLTASGKRPTFTLKDIERLADRQTASTAQYQELLEAILQSAELVELGADQGEKVYSTKSLRDAERELLTAAHNLAARGAHGVSAQAVTDIIAHAPALLGIDGPLSDDQAASLRHMATSGDLAIVEGYAGTGKSKVVEGAKLAWEAEGYKVVGAALAGKAAEGLQQDAGVESRTIASWLWNWERGKLRLTDRHVLVIDEAGMVGTAQLAALLEEARSSGAKIVLLGDTRQLQAIDPGAPMRLLQSRYGAATLSTVLRQKAHAWQKSATVAFATGKAEEALLRYVGEGRVHAHPTAAAAQDALVARWNADRQHQPTDSTLILAFRRADVRALNERAREIRKLAGELGTCARFQTERGEREFAANDRVYFLKNDTDLGVKNGTLGTIEAVQGSSLVVRLDNHKQVVVDTRQYDALDHGYAGTIHKSQGVTVDRAYVYANRNMDSSASYVAMSRHRGDAHMFYSQEEFASDQELAKHLSRDRTVEMVHEAAGRLNAAPRNASESRRIDADAAFVGLSSAERLSKLEALRLVGEQRTLRPEDFVAARADVRQATKARDAAAATLSEATQALERAAAQELERGERARYARAVEGAERDFRATDQAFGELRTRATVWAEAREQATRHNLKIRTAQKRWRALKRLHQDAERAEALAGYVAAANAKAAKPAFRVAGDQDLGRPFDELLRRRLGDHDILVLRARDNAELVVAYADHCGDGRGVRLIQPARTRGRPARSRGPER